MKDHVKLSMEPWYVFLHNCCAVTVIRYAIVHHSLYGRMRHITELIMVYLLMVLLSIILIVLGKKAKMEQMIRTGLVGAVFFGMAALMARRIMDMAFRNYGVIGSEICELLTLLYPACVLFFVRRNYVRICVRKDVFAGKRQESSKEIRHKTEEKCENVSRVSYLEEKIDINTCTAEELADLPGISLAAATRMIELRQQRGAFYSIDEFIVEAGVKPHFAVKILDRLTFSAQEINRTVKTGGRKLDI